MPRAERVRTPIRERNRYELCRYEISKQLRAEIERIPLKPMSMKSGHGGTGYADGWISGLHMARRLHTVNGSAISDAIEYLRDRVGGFQVVHYLVNRLEPRSTLATHRDGHCLNYRFHLPIVTNPDVFWWDEIAEQNLHFEAGLWYGPVPYSGVLHRMRNQGSTPRTHLVVDLLPPK